MSRAGADIPKALLDVELERLAASDAFRRSPRQLHLLLYLVEQVRAGHGLRLKESVLAIEVLGRSASHFDSAHDTAVRVMVRRLRQRLARYYAGEGAWAAVEIELPVGSYQVQFLRRLQNGGAKLPSIAVLPFLNFTGNPALNGFCDGLSDEITDALARLPGVKVVARTSAFRFRGVVADMRTIGQALGVATLLEGSVQIGASGGLKVVAQWVRAIDGYHAWSRTMAAAAGEANEVFQDHVARAIVAGLQLRLLQGDSSNTAPTPGLPASRRSSSVAAQELYNAGRYLLRLETIDGYRRAIDVLREATAADADFALAHCALGRALVSLIGMTIAPSNGLLTGARQALLRALAIDPELGEAHALSGFIQCAFDHDWAQAEPAFLRGIRNAPSLPYTHAAYAWALTMNARFAEADNEFRFARELDPLDIKLRTHHALVALYAGNDVQAISEFASVLQVEPGQAIARVLLATAHLWGDDADEAERRFEELLRMYPTLTIGEVGLAQVDALRGRSDSARERLARLTRDRRGVHLPPYQIAMIHSRLGDAAKAIFWLNKAATQRDMNFVCAPLDRTFAALRGDLRFTRLLQKHGLRPLWPTASA
ncbi:MAG: tetratricopeptide repeat protein [Betaproteobacteria bacterium]